MDYVKIRAHVADHGRFLDAGALARDLWVWGMLYAGKHETDGAIPMSAVMAAPWGAGGKGNVKLAQKLIEVGLWERTDTGYLVLRWSEQGNVSKASLTADREAARERMKRRRSSPERSPEHVANKQRTSPDVPTSTFNSSGSDSSLPGDARGDEPPEWWAGAVATAEMAAGPAGPPAARWLEYIGSRSRKQWATNHRDAVAWLVSVLRSERERASSRPQTKVQPAVPGSWRVPEGMP